jgi:hypothetical protein
MESVPSQSQWWALGNSSSMKTFSALGLKFELKTFAFVTTGLTAVSFPFPLLNQYKISFISKYANLDTPRFKTLWLRSAGCALPIFAISHFLAESPDDQHVRGIELAGGMVGAAVSAGSAMRLWRAPKRAYRLNALPHFLLCWMFALIAEDAGYWPGWRQTV